jgi:hypothetical protein
LQEDDGLVAVQVGLPGERVQQWAGLGAGAQLVLAVDVGDAARAAADRCAAQRPGRPAGPARGVDHKVSRQLHGVHQEAGGPAAPFGHGLGVPLAQLQPGYVQGRIPQRALERLATGPHAHRDLAAVGQPEPERLGAGGQPSLQRVGQFLGQRLLDLKPEPVGVVELHDSPPGPAAVRGGPGIALDRDHLVPAARQAGPGEQPSRPRADDGYPHYDRRLSFGILMMWLLH